MKIIEAMKRVKANKEKIADLQAKIAATSAHLNYETPAYDNPSKQVTEWVQACIDIGHENLRLLTAIQRTNLTTLVKIEIADRVLERPIAEWVWRRREYASLDLLTFSKLTDRGLKEGTVQGSTGISTEVKLVHNYDAAERDQRIAEFRSEPHLIDAALEVVNATTDLME